MFRHGGNIIPVPSELAYGDDAGSPKLFLGYEFMPAKLSLCGSTSPCCSCAGAPPRLSRGLIVDFARSEDCHEGFDTLKLSRSEASVPPV
mmetsp:Transcript_37311/g.73967  ORF Transcript_37311/g.73967 Transcript_37311/m.73967 type:complete len:90 (-) Transcript_37311:1384-1653(-)